VPQGSTYMHHAHILAKYQKTLELSGCITSSPGRPTTTGTRSTLGSQQRRSGAALQRFRFKAASPWSVAKPRFTGGPLGDGYVSFTHVDGRNVNALADSLELLHATAAPL